MSNLIKVPLYNEVGEAIGEQSLNSEVFAIKPNPMVIKQVVVAQQANSRQVLAHTKNKGEIRGGGKKPWKQKGTGRARAGSSRSPLWRGGGVIFGPRKNRNFSLKINKQVKNLALRMVLSDKVNNQHLLVVEKMPDITKTKQLQKMLMSLPSKQNKCLLILGETSTVIIKSARNLKFVRCLAANSLNTVDLLNRDYLVVDQAAVKTIEQVYKRRKKLTQTT